MGCNSIIPERKVSVYEGEGMITFRKITEFPRGTLVSLLRKGYSFEPQFERDWLEQWKEFDDFFYDHPEIADFSGFMTVMDEKPIGFVSWNPTQLPELVEIGHNCIAAEYKGKGYGKQQMQEAVRRVISQGAKRIAVCTNAILLPAQRTYESAGFRQYDRGEEPICAEYAGERIYYEMMIEEDQERKDLDNLMK